MTDFAKVSGPPVSVTQTPSQPRPRAGFSRNSTPKVKALSESHSQRSCPFCAPSSDLPSQEKSVEGERREGSNLMEVCRVGGQREEQVRGVGVQAYALAHAVKSKITPSHLSRISQGVLVGLVGQVGQEVQFFHNLVSQVGQVTLEVLWVQQLNPLLGPISDKKDFFECIGSTTAGPPSLVATFSNGLTPHRCS